jgi:hypothetical protein
VTLAFDPTNPNDPNDKFDVSNPEHVSAMGYEHCDIQDAEFQCVRYRADGKQYVAGVPSSGMLMDLYDKESVVKCEDSILYKELPCWKRGLFSEYAGLGIWQWFSFPETGGKNILGFHSVALDRYTNAAGGVRWNIFHKARRHSEDSSSCVVSLRGTRNQGEFLTEDLPAFMTCGMDPRDNWKDDKQTLNDSIEDADRVVLNVGFMNSVDKYYIELSAEMKRLSTGVCADGFDVVGHSLGGALAPVAAMMIKLDPLLSSVRINDIISFAGPAYVKISYDYAQAANVASGRRNECVDTLRGKKKGAHLDATSSCHNFKKLVSGATFRFARTSVAGATTEPFLSGQDQSDVVTRIPFALTAGSTNVHLVLRLMAGTLNIPKLWISGNAVDDSMRWSVCSDHSYLLASEKEAALNDTVIGKSFLRKTLRNWPENAKELTLGDDSGVSQDVICSDLVTWLTTDHGAGWHDPLEYSTLTGLSPFESTGAVYPTPEDWVVNNVDYSSNYKFSTGPTRKCAQSKTALPDLGNALQTICDAI